MPAYLIVELKIRDPENYKRYTARSPAIIAMHGGRFLARGGTVETLEGGAFEGRLVIVEFPSMEAARAFYHSPEYRQAKEIRVAASTDARFLLMPGVE